MLIQTKRILKNRSEKLFVGITTGIVALYVSLIVFLSLWDTLDKIVFIPLIFVVIFCILITIKPKILISNQQINKDCEAGNSAVFFITVLFIVLAGQMLYWLAYFPGGFNLDAYGQWDQVHGLQHLNNWHPVFTTICYWLITRISDSFALCIFTQQIIFSISISYLLLILNRLNIHRRLLMLTALYISLNPAIGMNNICLIKDVPFAIALIWMTINLIKIIVTNGAWLRSIMHSVCIVINLLIISLIRHNGIFYVVPALLCVAVIYRQYLKTIAVIVLAYVLGLALINGPVYSYFGVEEHGNLTGEVVGVPMAIMANNFVSDAENTPAEVESFLLAIADKDEWKDKYILGEWDSCKWDFGGIELFQDVSINHFTKLTIASICASPDAAYQSIRENTRVVWQVLGPVEWITGVYVEENDYGIYEDPYILCSDIANNIVEFSATTLGTFLCWNIGVPNIILALFLWVVVVRKEYQKIIIMVPIMAYNILTMFLLCGPSHRYFYFNSVLILPIVLCLIYDINMTRLDSACEAIRVY